MQSIKKIAQRTLGRFGFEMRRIRRADTMFTYLPAGQPATVLDIGANTGQFARSILAKIQGCQVHCFEPLPNAFKALEDWAGQHPNVKCHNIALGSASGQLPIHTGAYTPSSSLIPPAKRLADAMPHVTPTRTELVPIVTLDAWAETTPLTPPTLVKMDVQGYELEVIRGGEKTLGGCSAILTELSFIELYEGQPLIREILDALGSLGFELADIYDITRNPVTGFGFQCDGLFLPRSQVRGEED